MNMARIPYTDIRCDDIAHGFLPRVIVEQLGIHMIAKLSATACVLAAMFLPSANAQAATGPQIDSLSCHSGDSHFYCYLDVSGGVAPYRVNWTAINGMVAESGEDSASGPCTVDTKVKATAAVTDAAGARVTGSAYTQCHKLWP
jgi:hypothetical protein